MPDDYSFDIVSEVDLQLIDDAVNVAMREITTRFDLKDTGATVTLDKENKTITFFAPSDFQVKQIRDILMSKFAKRAISPKILNEPKREDATGGCVREICTIITGIESELAKKIIRDIKDLKLKVQPSLHEEKIRVVSRKKDELQTVIAFVREKNYSIPLQFINYR